MTEIADTQRAATTSGRNGTTVAEQAGTNRITRLSKSTTEVGQTRQAKPGATKTDVILKKLGAPKGVSIQMLMEATGWQAHSVRGFLSGTVKKKLGLTVDNEVGKDGTRRYRIAKPSVGG